MNATFTWDVSPGEVFVTGFESYLITRDAAIERLIQQFVPQIEEDMKASAPWTDRTGNLRASLHAYLIELVNGVGVVFAYGLDYGVFLEFANGGRYAIIGPTLDKWAPVIWSAVVDLFGGSGFLSTSQAAS